MTVSEAQLLAFIEKYPVTEPLQPTQVLGDDPGSFTLEILETRLQAWADANPEFTFDPGRTSKGPGFYLRCPGDIEGGWPDGAVHGDIIGHPNGSMAVWVENGFPRFSCRHAHCGEGAAQGKKTWKHLQEYFDPSRALHSLKGNVTIGGVRPAATVTVREQNPPEEGVSVQTFPSGNNETVPLPKYPFEVWDGTDYAEFAETCAQNCYIPREFLVESLKTITGAVLGSAITVEDVEGAIPRFYTVLMGPAGSGKGTSISWATSVFKDIAAGTGVFSLLWSPATKIEDVPWTRIGACEEGFNSAQGMQRSNEKGQSRWLQTFEELDHLIEGSGIEGSGKALMGVNRQLYDREEFATTTTGKRDAIAGKAKNSLLACTTPELWTDMFAGKQVKGSGLFQRFNLMASEESRKKGTIRRPKLDVFKTRFAARILDMEENPIELTVDPAAEVALDEWYRQGKFDEADGEVRGRLNVLAWRNALHLAWQRRHQSIRERDILDAIRLSDYQFEIRRLYTPAEGENHGALVENKIRNLLRVIKRATRRDVVRKLSLNRYGGFIIDRAINSLRQSGEIDLAEGETTGKGGRKAIYLLWVEQG